MKTFKNFFVEVLKLKKVDAVTKVSNTDPPYYVTKMNDNTWSVWDNNPTYENIVSGQANELSVFHKSIVSATQHISFLLRQKKGR